MEPRDVLANLFERIGQAKRQDSALASMGALGEQFTDFLTMPLDLALLLVERSTEMAELVLATLAEAGYVVVKGTTPL